MLVAFTFASFLASLFGAFHLHSDVNIPIYPMARVGHVTRAVNIPIYPMAKPKLRRDVNIPIYPM